MKKFILNISMLLILISFLASCKTTQKASSFEVETNKEVVFLDSIGARKAIIYDTHDNFFEDITALDMAIQAKIKDHQKLPKSEISKQYKKYLQDDVTNFTKDEKKLLTEIFKEIHTYTNQLSNNIFPKKLLLIKSHERPYGPGTFYTRENCIVIPYGAFKTMDRDAMYGVMLHELFHVYSRLNNNKRLEIYDLIGFKPFEHDEFALRDSLKKRILLNPDGVKRYYITLDMGKGETIDAMPIIVAKDWNYNPAKKLFFQYLDFELFEVNRTKIEGKGAAVNRIISNPDGSSTHVVEELPDFFRQIKDNTNYIIHPDEIMADNFMMLIQGMKDRSVYTSLSADGQVLQDLLKAVLEKK